MIPAAPPDDVTPAATAGVERSASACFGLVLAVSLPFFVPGLWHLPMPGLPILPARALMRFMPMAAALILARARWRTGLWSGIALRPSALAMRPGSAAVTSRIVVRTGCGLVAGR